MSNKHKYWVEHNDGIEITMEGLSVFLKFKFGHSDIKAGERISELDGPNPCSEPCPACQSKNIYLYSGPQNVFPMSDSGIFPDARYDGDPFMMWLTFAKCEDCGEYFIGNVAVQDGPDIPL